MRMAILFLLGAASFPQSMPLPRADLGGANLPAHEIGFNDLIAVSVYDAPEFTRTIRVSAEGYIRLPMVPRDLKAGGLLPIQMEAVIAEALRAEHLLNDPAVTVTIAEYHSRPISVAGAVNKPITFQAAGPVTLIEAITRAGGLRPDAGKEIHITTSQSGEDGKPLSLTQRIPVKGLIEGSDAELNIQLHGGEKILIAEIGKIFVVGNVKRPGAYPVQDSAQTTVMQMVALAEGLMPYAGKTAYIYRREASGSKNEIPIELAKIMNRKAPDVPLVAEDILYITDRKSRRMTIRTLERIATFGAATASGVLIYSTFR